MSERRTTVMILMPGRNAISIALPRSPRRALGLALLLPLITGVFAQRYVGSAPTSRVAMASLLRVPGPVARMSTDLLRTLTSTAPKPRPALPVRVPTPPPPAAPELPPSDAAPETVTLAATTPVLDVKAMLRSMKKGTASSEDVEKIPCTGSLRLEALHLNEQIAVRPFDAALAPDPGAMAQINHVMRCRITGTEVPIDTRLVQVLVKLHTLYGRAIQLVSGHRQPHTIGTKKTSQHALGRAADIRIPGVGIEELKRVAMKLGARGIGLYPEKGFVHVDVREKARYYWVYTAADGEQADMSTPRPARPKSEPSSADGDPESESEGEEHEEAAHASQPAAAMPAVAAQPAPAAPRKPRPRSQAPAESAPVAEPSQPVAAMPENPYDVAPQPAPAPGAPGSE